MRTGGCNQAATICPSPAQPSPAACGPLCAKIAELFPATTQRPAPRHHAPRTTQQRRQNHELDCDCSVRLPAVLQCCTVCMQCRVRTLNNNVTVVSRLLTPALTHLQQKV